MKHHGGWRVVWHPDRSLEWITPTGYRHVTRPYDVGLGAVAGDRHRWWQVMASPGGLTYCLVAEPHRARPRPVTWPDGHRSRVAQVCLDVPDVRFDAELDFWRGATGWPDETTRSPEFARLTPPSTSPMYFLLQRLGPDDRGTARMHLDLGTDDPAAEVERVRAAGAEHGTDARPWVVLRDPTGLPFCVTPRPRTEPRRRRRRSGTARR